MVVLMPEGFTGSTAWPRGVIGERAPDAAFVAAIPVSGDDADRGVTQPVPDPLDLEREFLRSARVGAGGDRTAATIGVRLPLGNRDVR